ncbi:hypothetical protein M441DRAFT_343617 [Trichoderma asperellum CBS 433.97]|uniref:Uncharacterized protein n=1 Tax=Trichoderma asperellum (strain ATCC 204424 / CBS 433.97 / NBRC 101777) TaxID=1042311 RepID=A0A2T3ZHC9_TRIA4|nr:hypothetical protein M441DRAFT_343617 [Trichoderma asperellum CBS 433.97]PTB44200.1 hypothetical protein M441DRAFT_343617 [Trichoderma asperellum CBS 433.97]
MISKLAVIESAHTMQPLQATHLFTFGLPASPISLSLEGLVLQYLKQASQSVQRVEEVSPLSSGPTCSSSPDDATALLTEMGDYLTRTAMIWAYLIENLIKGPHIDHVTLQILENSRAKTNVADLTEATSLDITLGRLRKMRDMAAQHSQDIQTIWKLGSHRKASLSCLVDPRPSSSLHSEDTSAAASAASSESNSMPEVFNNTSHAAECHKQIADAVALLQDGATVGRPAHAPLPSLPLLPPAQSLDLPPIWPTQSSVSTSPVASPPPAPQQQQQEQKRQQQEKQQRQQQQKEQQQKEKQALLAGTRIFLANELPGQGAQARATLRKLVPLMPAPRRTMLKKAMPKKTGPRPVRILTPIVAPAPPPPPPPPPPILTPPPPPFRPPPRSAEEIAMAASASAALENILEEVEEEDSDEYSDDGLFAGINLKALKQRGKGKYYCPRGHRCDKGGVDKSGNLILFDRNSSFAYVETSVCQHRGKPNRLSPVVLLHPNPKPWEMWKTDALGQVSYAPASMFANLSCRQHCNKHRKPWRCDVPGCPNPPKKRRFARRDGLERHKATVKHYFMAMNANKP